MTTEGQARARVRVYEVEVEVTLYRKLRVEVPAEVKGIGQRAQVANEEAEKQAATLYPFANKVTARGHTLVAEREEGD